MRIRLVCQGHDDKQELFQASSWSALKPPGPVAVHQCIEGVGREHRFKRAVVIGPGV
jgi:hypothetical protein